MLEICYFVNAVGSGIGLVERMFIFFLHMWSMEVVIDLGRCFRTRSDARPGYETKKLASMDFIHVDGTGINALVGGRLRYQRVCLRICIVNIIIT